MFLTTLSCRRGTVRPQTETKLLFTYSVVWRQSEVRWASRWDVYLAMSDVQIHWFSIVNSVVVVLFLSGACGLPGDRAGGNVGTVHI